MSRKSIPRAFALAQDMHLDILNIMILKLIREVTPLQEWMTEAGLKDRQVAEKVGLSRVHVSRIRRGLLGASVPAAKRLEELTRIPHWKFLTPWDGRNRRAGSRASRSKRSSEVDMASKHASGRTSEMKIPAVADGVSALDRNTRAMEELTSALRMLGKRLSPQP